MKGTLGCPISFSDDDDEKKDRPTIFISRAVVAPKKSKALVKMDKAI